MLPHHLLPASSSAAAAPHSLRRHVFIRGSSRITSSLRVYSPPSLSYSSSARSYSAISPERTPRNSIPHSRPASFIGSSPSPFPRHHFAPHSFPVRNIMSSAPAKKEFLCILPDFPGAQAKRLEVRPAHLEGVKPLVASGEIVAGGAMLESHPAEGEVPNFKGSMMLAVAESEAEVRALLEKDIYSRSGVWDLANAQIIPFKSAVRKEL